MMTAERCVLYIGRGLGLCALARGLYVMSRGEHEGGWMFRLPLYLGAALMVWRMCRQIRRGEF